MEKDEALIAGGIGAPKPLKIGNSAAYFSYGRADDRYPGLASSKGYEMIFPAGSRVLCCNIAMYGTYIPWKRQISSITIYAQMMGIIGMGNNLMVLWM